MRTGKRTVVMHYSMVKLPEKPMMPRLFDERVGYFRVRKMDYGMDEHRAPQRVYITRWRLEKKDPNCRDLRTSQTDRLLRRSRNADQVGPVDQERDRGLAAGVRSRRFQERDHRQRRAAKEDPDWSPEDARYSVIRWLPSTIENASGPHIHDPRTGEILESDIQMYHNMMNLQRNWYFCKSGPLDPRAKKLPLPDDLMGELLRLCRRARSRPYSRFSTQHEGQLDVPVRKSSRSEMAQREGPYADDDGLFAFQLRRAA